MEIREALVHIAEIRRHVARSDLFGGYRPLPVAFSGLLALATAGVQAWIWRDLTPAAFLAVWVGVALMSLVVSAIEMAWSARRAVSSLERQKTWLAVSQFAPCLVAGGLLLAVLAVFAPETLWVLPGMWAIFFSLGIFASWRLLPPAVTWVGVFYLATGICSLALARGSWALSPWAMGLPFGLGQLLSAVILHRSPEQSHGPRGESR